MDKLSSARIIFWAHPENQPKAMNASIRTFVPVPSRLHHVEKFFLSEVLALTGYKPPHSLFGGTFSSTGFGQFHTQTSKNFDRYRFSR